MGLQISPKGFISLFLATSAFIVVTITQNSEIQGKFFWHSCGGVAKKVGLLSLSSCSSIGFCTLNLNQTYYGSFSISPNGTHNASTITVTSLTRQMVLYSGPLNTQLNSTRSVNLQFPLRFDSRFATNRTKERQNIKVTVTALNRNQLVQEACRTFHIYLNSTTRKHGIFA